jgi:hypothetical protein
MIARRTIRRHHDDWLSLLDRSGPFLTLPVLSRTWPAGLDPVPRELMDEVRPAFDTWREDPVGRHHPWITFVLSHLLEWRECLLEGPSVPETLEVAVPEHGTLVRADLAFSGPDGTVSLLGTVLSPGTPPAARMTGGWAASPADRLALLLRKHQVPLGLVTDGRWWALVWAPPEGVTSVAVWDAALWLEERETLAAFRCLLERRRFLGVPDGETLPALLSAGLEQQEEITDGLGHQVRQAVEMLVEAIGRAGRQGGPAEGLLADLDPNEVYHGAVTVMMRLLFLLFAEERLLLPADDELYLTSYSAGHLVDALRSEANLTGEDALELRTAAWQRLLSLFRGIHRGIAHDRLRIPAYGGGVFDPNRHPWLEGKRSADEVGDARVLPIDDRTVLHALEALQYVRIRDERRRLSFRTLDVEQIGYVYEGLLGYDARRASEPVVGLVGKAGEEPEVPLSDVETITDDATALAELTGLSEGRIRKLLADDGDLHREQLLRVACSGDEDLVARVRPIAGLLRLDLRGLPVIVPSGGLYVTVSPRRRLSGTHYTPRDLAERVVIGALEPLVYSPGPLDTGDRAAWRLRSSADILGLKVADIAMGSGAFLVGACRYLAGQLLEAWAREGDVRALERLQGRSEVPVDVEADPVVVDARRQVIEHCLYGGDINEMAVEMAKLSLWLVSLSRERPFSFLDDRLVCGDSLLGLTSLDQVRLLHFDPAEARRKGAGEQGFDFWGQVRETLDEAERLRRTLADRPLIDIRDAQVKAALLAEAQKVTRALVVVADAMVGVAMASCGSDHDAGDDVRRFPAQVRHMLGEDDPGARETRLQEMADTAAYRLDTGRPEGAFDRRPTHWPLAFPEVFEAGGFDAVIGNPPFLGGTKLSGSFGGAYREFLAQQVSGSGPTGRADLIAYFLLTSHKLLNSGGQGGLIGTNTVAQGDTREIGLDALIANGATIRGAVKSAKWPTRTVNLEYSIIWWSRQPLEEAAVRVLDGKPVILINSFLDAAQENLGRPFRLITNADSTFEGSKPDTMGFVLNPDEAMALIARDPRNRDVLFPYVNGDDLNSRPDCSGSRWAINFRDWQIDRAERYPDCLEILRTRVLPAIRAKPASYAGWIDRWWQYWRVRAELYRTIEHMDRVLAIALTSKVVLPVRVPTGMVYSHATGVFAYEDGGHLALLSSAFHYWWAITYASTLETRIRYTPSDVFETFPQPVIASRVEFAGEALDAHRHRLMIERDLGLTALYNLVNSSAVADAEIARLRASHVEIDQAVAEAYGWGDIRLGHGFHDTAQGVRFTISAPARREVLRRLLELNHERHAEEETRGLTGAKGRRTAGKGGGAVQTPLFGP